MVFHVVGLVVEVVDSADEEVVGDVVEVAAVFEPRTCHGDVVGGTLAFDLDEEAEAFEVGAFPDREWIKELEAGRGGAYLNLDGGAVGGGGDVACVFYIKATGWKFVPCGRVEHDFLAIGVDELVLEGVEAEVACDGEGGDELWAAHEGVGVGVAVGALGEVAVEGVNDGVFLCPFCAFTVPHADARSASVCEYAGANLVEGVDKAVALDGISDLFGPWCNGELGLGSELFVHCLLSQGGGTADVFVGGVGAGANEADADVEGPAVCEGDFAHFGDRGGEVWGEGAVEVGFEFGEVDLDDFVEVLGGVGVDFGVACEVEADAICEVGDIGAAGRAEVTLHGIVVAEGGGGGSDLSTHVADGAFAGTGEGDGTFAEVFHNFVGTAFDGHDASDFEDNVFG